MNLKTSIEKLINKKNLDSTTCQNALNQILAEDANLLQSAAFLVLLRAKPETAEELMGLMNTLKKNMLPVSTHHKVLDIVGTGGDGANTINISTGSAILAASCGIKIAKHGNRAVSSLTGSADVLEALGVVIDLSPEKINACIDEIGIGFYFSPHFNPALYKLRSFRKKLNVPTTFNILGPLLNPANPAHLLLGVFDESLLTLIASTLKHIGTKRSIVVHGHGLDEISCVGPAQLLEVTSQNIIKHTLDPRAFGFNFCSMTDLKGGNAKTNAKLLLNTYTHPLLTKNRAISDTLILNAAVALYLYGLYSSIAEAIPHAKENLYNGSAFTLLKNWIEFSHD